MRGRFDGAVSGVGGGVKCNSLEFDNGGNNDNAKYIIIKQ